MYNSLYRILPALENSSDSSSSSYPLSPLLVHVDHSSSRFFPLKLRITLNDTQMDRSQTNSPDYWLDREDPPVLTSYEPRCQQSIQGPSPLKRRVILATDDKFKGNISRSTVHKPNTTSSHTPKPAPVSTPAPAPILEQCSPLHLPLHRRLETLVVLWHVSSFILLSIFSLVLIATPFTWFLAIPYLIYYFSDKSPANGNVVKRYSPWFRSLPIWKWYCDYFPITLVKTCNLEPTFTLVKDSGDDGINNNKTVPPVRHYFKDAKVTGPRYIFGYHPHGVGAMGAFGSIATEGCHWSQKFSGIPVSLLTLSTQFHIPLYRDYLSALGISSVSRKNALKVLDRGFSICIVVGGARESLISSKTSIDLILNNRKGFIKLALQTGDVSLVPVFGFGESDCYRIFVTSDNSYMRKIQLWVKENCGFTIPLFYARGIFNYDVGLMPFRKPIHVVVGEPIYVKEKFASPPDELIEHYHTLYINALRKLFEDNKDKYGYSQMELRIVG